VVVKSKMYDELFEKEELTQEEKDILKMIKKFNDEFKLLRKYPAETFTFAS